MTNMHQIELLFLILEIIIKIISSIWQPNNELIWLFEIHLSPGHFLRHRNHKITECTHSHIPLAVRTSSNCYKHPNPLRYQHNRL